MLLLIVVCCQLLFGCKVIYSATSANSKTSKCITESFLNTQSLIQQKNSYDSNGEFIFQKNFITNECLAIFSAEINEMYPKHVHRVKYFNRKGGAIPYSTVTKFAPNIYQFYQNAFDDRFLTYLEFITNKKLYPCPSFDEHSAVAYIYDEEGDWIQWHYDTSWYSGSRYTLLIGVENTGTLHNSTSSHSILTAVINNVTEELHLMPGDIVLFNGNHIRHTVTPLHANERRIVISMEFVTSIEISMFGRSVSWLKDYIAYFGNSNVFYGVSFAIVFGILYGLLNLTFL